MASGGDPGFRWPGRRPGPSRRPLLVAGAAIGTRPPVVAVCVASCGMLTAGLAPSERDGAPPRGTVVGRLPARASTPSGTCTADSEPPVWPRITSRAVRATAASATAIAAVIATWLSQACVTCAVAAPTVLFTTPTPSCSGTQPTSPLRSCGLAAGVRPAVAILRQPATSAANTKTTAPRRTRVLRGAGSVTNAVSEGKTAAHTAVARRPAPKAELTTHPRTDAAVASASTRKSRPCVASALGCSAVDISASLPRGSSPRSQRQRASNVMSITYVP